MELTLTVIDHDGAPPPAVAKVTTRNGKVTIGRIDGNDLVLARDDISRCHAQIFYRDGHFVLTDRSVNGVLLNSADTRVEPFSQVPLHHNDTLGIGSYLIRVSILEDSGQAMPPRRRDDDEHHGSDLLGGLLEGPAPNVLDVYRGGDDISGTGERLGNPVPRTKDDIDSPPLIPRHQESRDSQGGFEQKTTPPPPPVTSVENEACDDLLNLLTGEAVRQISKEGPSPSPDAGGEIDRSDIQVGEAGDARRGKGRPQPEEAKSLDSSSSMATGERDGRAIQAFLEGFGIGPEEIPDDRLDDVMRQAGKLLNAMSTELVTAMRGRSIFKGVIHTDDMTQFGAGHNNLFKFSVDGEDALRKHFVDKAPGYRGPEESAVEAFHDLRAHEAALIAGVRGALHSLVARFLPSELEKRFQQGSLLDNMLPQNRKAKCWDLFVETYNDVAADATEDFRRLFRSAFQSAYQDQVLRLKREWQTQQESESLGEER